VRGKDEGNNGKNRSRKGEGKGKMRDRNHRGTILMMKSRVKKMTSTKILRRGTGNVWGMWVRSGPGGGNGFTAGHQGIKTKISFGGLAVV
jgi:hypothetical protein